VPWVSQIIYLGVHLCNLILVQLNKHFFQLVRHAKFNNKIIHLSLQETFCKPILTYGNVAVYLTAEQTQILNCCWNSVYRQIFGFNKLESVSCFICGVGRLDLCHINLLNCAKFYKPVNMITNLVLNNLYCLLCGNAYNSDAGLSLAQVPYGQLKICICNDFTRQTSCCFS
jgi:hypothetical protein